MPRLMDASLPIGFVFAGLLIVFMVVDPGWMENGGRIFQSLLYLGNAVFIIWLGWEWRKRPRPEP